MKQRILVVDDEPPIRDLLQIYFVKHDFEVTTASDADSTFRFLENNKVDLLLLDMLLPDSDGLEMLHRLKNFHPAMPVIIMTGMGSNEELLQEALAKGASGYVSKTLPLDQLLMEARRVLQPAK